MKVLEQRGIPYNCIDAGQHGGITGAIIKQFQLREPDVYLQERPETISSIGAALKWTSKIMGKLLLQPQEVFAHVFKASQGICLIHGDTLTTLISLIYAKRCGLKVAHVEAGLRSYKYLDPFPEEIVRLVAMRFSDILFAPSHNAFKNLCRMGYKGKTINIKANTGFDAAAFAVRHHTQCPTNDPHQVNHVVVTIHRMETIFSKTRMELIVDVIMKVAHTFDVIFVLHAPTLKQLEKYNLLARMDETRIKLRPLQPYIPFINLLEKACFVMTDGGSVQEECFFLNKPCLIMRSKTEREEGIGENAMLSKLDPERISRFITHYADYKRSGKLDKVRPSESIVDHLTSKGYTP